MSTEARPPAPVRAVLVAASGLGGCACAALALRRYDGAGAPPTQDGASSSPFPVVGLVLALVLLTVVTAVAHRALGRRLILTGRGAAQAEPAVRVRPDPATTLSHEVRTPLNAVVGLTELLMTSRLDTLQREQVTQLRRSAMVILGLVDEVLDRALVDADRLVVEQQPFELPDVLADVVELLQVEAAAKGVRLQVELDPSCPRWVRGDAPRLRQVLVNLLGNAVKFTETGVVSVEVCRAARPERPAALYFQVTDTGSGIPTEELARIFEPYARLAQPGRPRQRGSGLGLSISQALVRAMGGEIVATSQEGLGSAFGFELVLPRARVPATVGATLANRRILLLDRQPLRAAGTADELRGWGAEVEVASPRQWSGGGPELVMVREDHPDELVELGSRLRRASAGRPSFLVVTASAYAVPGDALRDDDLVVGAGTAGRRLRAALASVERPRPRASEPHPAGIVERPLRVLLAEDDPTSRQVCAALVRLLGHEVDVVADGAAAVRAASSAAYDLVLMDSQMPELDGAEATQAIRAGEAGGRRVRVIALTGAVTAADRHAYAAAGMDGLLAKPLTRARLAEVLADVPRQHEAQTAVPGPRREARSILPLAS